MTSSQLRVDVLGGVLSQQCLRLIKVVSIFDGRSGFRIRSVRRSSVSVAGSVDPVPVQSGHRGSVDVVVVVQSVLVAEAVAGFDQLRFDNGSDGSASEMEMVMKR